MKAIYSKRYTTFAHITKRKIFMSKDSVSNYQVPKTVSFIMGAISRFSAEEYVPYEVELFSYVKAADPTKIKLPAGMADEWDRLNGIGMEINKVAAASVNTKAKRNKDAERDRLLTHLFGIIRLQRYSPIPAKAEAAERLSIAVAPYLGAQEKRFDIESGLIFGLEKDLGKMAADVAAVGLTETLAELHTVNAAYIALSGVSDAEEIDRSKLPTIADVRSAIDKIHQAACQILQANYLTTTKDEERTAIEELVDQMNRVTQRYKSRHNISESEKKAAGKNPKQPKDPKEPKPKPEPKPQPDPKPTPDPKPQPDPKPKPDPKPGDDGDDDVYIPKD